VKRAEEGRGQYLRDGVLSGAVDDVVLGALASHVVDAHEFEQTGVDEAHAHAVPHVHGREVGHDRQRRPETVRRREKVQHGGDADHDARWHRVPLEPERDERTRHQDDARNEDGREVERAVPRENQLHAQTAVVSCGRNQQGIQALKIDTNFVETR